MEVVFNRCWVFRDTKCGIYKSKCGNYKPNWTKRSLGFQPVIPDAAYLIMLATP